MLLEFKDIELRIRKNTFCITWYRIMIASYSQINFKLLNCDG